MSQLLQDAESHELSDALEKLGEEARPVAVSAISLHFRKLVVRFLEVPDVFLIRDRSASRMANGFSSRTDRRTFR